jgi:hypothetical protein
LIDFADLLIDSAELRICLAVKSILLADVTTLPMMPVNGAAASRICPAVSCTWARIGTTSSLLLIGVTALLMTPTRLSIRFAVLIMPGSISTANSAQTMTSTSMMPGRALAVKRRIQSPPKGEKGHT